MKEIRDIKLDILMGNKNPIVELFNSITNDIKIINCDVYNNGGLEFIYFNEKKEWIFYQDAKNSKFWVNYNRYWEIFELRFNLGYIEIQELTKFLVENTLKREVHTPHYGGSFSWKLVDETLKKEVGTGNAWIMIYVRMEEVLNKEIAKPQSKFFENP